MNSPVTDAQENHLTLETPMQGVLAGGEQVIWTFEAEYGQVISLSAERFPPDPDSELDLALVLTDPAGNIVGEDDNSSVGLDAIILYYPVAQTGVYQVTVKNQYEWAGGTYQLTLAESTLPTGCQTPFGQMIVSEFPSVVAGYAVRYRIFMPPCAETTNRRYPYVILGHGSNSSDEHWEQLGVDDAIVRGIALNRLPPMVVVSAWGGELANTNTFYEGQSWEYAVIDEFMPHLESQYCVIAERSGRAIGGISRGGFWAFEIAFRHPDLFSSLGGHSPFFDLYHAPADYNPLDLAMNTVPNPPLRIWMDRGKDDYAQVNIDLMHQRLTEAGIVHEFQLYPVGQHENAYWSAHVDDYLNFYGQGFYGAEWQNAVSNLPACHE